MQFHDILSAYEHDLKALEEYLEKQHLSKIQLIPEITNYIIDSGGKRFRPLLLMISSALCGYRGERRLILAAVLEFIHTASLLHDDVIDHADIRRGKTSANRVWGNTASVLVGDYLYATSFKMLIEDGDPAIQNLFSLATTTMVEGETAQHIKCGDIGITEEDYFSIIEKKTAVLIAAACATGAILGKEPEEKVKALYEFGLRLGTAFQLTDDTLDYVAKEDEFGKAIGMDILEGKITLPLLATLRRCSPPEKDTVRRIVAQKNTSPKDINTIMTLVNKYGGIAYALDKTRAYIAEAAGLLDVFEDSIPKQTLLSLCNFILARKL